MTGERRQIKRAKTFALKPRRACGSCNSGWLNRLEDAVRPTMAALAQRTPTKLDREEQEVLALWAAFATLAFLSTSLEDKFRFASPDLARELHRQRRPPAGMQIWLGANTHGEAGWFGSHSLDVAQAPGREDLWGATLAFGFGVLHAVFHGLPDQHLRLHYEAHQSLRRIWPTQPSVDWPPPLLLRPRDLTPLATAVGIQGRFVRAAPTSG